MGTKAEKDKTKQLQDKCQAVLNGLLRDEDNKYCVDCDSKGPRWASWNIGVFLCIRCAGIHRNLGVHISKVKSVNLDTWTPEQVVSLQQMGNSRARAVYEANLPDNFRRPQNDSSLETFIRAKYEHKKYIAREWVPPTLPKVNWEKEIDEEIEKQKRKKKTIVDKHSLGSVEVPQLPKPKNASPKPNRIINAPEAVKKDGDLLGLQNGGDDTFSGFLSGPAPCEAPKKVEEETAAQSEEESFFNQTAPTEKEKIKLTKDSILALYGNAPVNAPFTQFPPQAQQPFQGNFPAPQFGAFPASGQQQGFSAPAQQQGFTAPPAGQFTAHWPTPSQQFGPQGQMAHANHVGQFGSFQGGQFGQFQQGSNANATQSAFYANQNGLQQQFGNLNLNKPSTNSTPTLATNIWQ